MLPTLGLFRVFPCPYYVVGLCERPHCSFRHCRSDVEAARREASGFESDAKHESGSEAESEECLPSRKAGKERLDEQKQKKKYQKVINSSSGESFNKVVEKSTNSLKDNKRNLDSKKIRNRDSDSSQDLESPKKRIKLEGKLECGNRKSSVDKGLVLTENPTVFKEITQDAEQINKDEYKSSSRKTKDDQTSRPEKVRKDSQSHHKSHKHKKSHKDSHHSSSRHSSNRSSSSKSSTSRSKDTHSSKNSTSSSKHISSKHNGKEESRSARESVVVSSTNDSHRDTSKDEQNIQINDYKVDEDITFMEDIPDDVPDDFLYPSDEDDDPDQIAMECFKMFQNYKSDVVPAESIKLETVPEPKNAVSSTSELEQYGLGKKRVAHAGAIKSVLDAAVPPKRKETAHEQLMKRFQALQESKNLPSVSSNNFVPSNANQPRPPRVTVNTSAASSSKRRIAHVANASALMKPPSTGVGGETSSSQKFDSQLGYRANGASKVSSVTLSQTVGKGERRVAHTSSSNTSSSAASPKITPDSKGKVPALVRQGILDQIYRECQQIYPDSESASKRAVEEEKLLVAKCNTRQVYRCAATNLIARLRKEYRESSSEIPTQLFPTSVNRTVSHSDILTGKSGNVSWSIEKKTTFNPVGCQLYLRMKDYLMSASELIENGYPRKCPSTYKGCSGLAIIKPRDDTTYSRVIEDSSRKTCDRCGVSYLVSDDGFPVSKELCTYHTGRRFGKRTRTGNAETRYNCCDGDPNSIGCCTAACHVSTGKSPDDLKNFICAALEAGEDAKMGSNVWDTIGVDCEMVYTTRGTELARATFVSADGKVIYDTLVKPSNPVLDYNTRYSGIDEAMLENTTTTMKEVHLKILANLKPNSIIVGHSLENDLIALKLIHDCVVDTSLVFPHKRGLPFKRALRNLSAEYLGKIIQVGDTGHDSAEDARAALDLMIWKVKNDHQKAPRRSTGSD